MKRKERLGDDWTPAWEARQIREQKHKLKKMRDHKLMYPPELTNKQRHHIRRQAREDARKIVKEVGL